MSDNRIACGRLDAGLWWSRAVLGEVFEGNPGGVFSKLLHLFNFGTSKQRDNLERPAPKRFQTLEGSPHAFIGKRGKVGNYFLVWTGPKEGKLFWKAGRSFAKIRLHFAVRTRTRIGPKEKKLFWKAGRSFAKIRLRFAVRNRTRAVPYRARAQVAQPALGIKSNSLQSMSSDDEAQRSRATLSTSRQGCSCSYSYVLIVQKYLLFFDRYMRARYM